VLDLAEEFFEIDEADFSDSEEALVDLLLPAAEIPVPHRLANAQVIDPNGDGRVGQYWYPPRLLGDSSGLGCHIELDVPPVPIVAGWYIEGDPTTPPSRQVERTIEIMDANSTLFVQITILDTREQRDAFLRGQLEFAGASSEGACGFVSLEETFGVGSDFDVFEDLGSGVFPELLTFEPSDTGYAAWGIFRSGGLAGDGERRLYAVGNRLLVDVDIGRGFFQRSSDELILSSTDVDRVVDLLIERLTVAGYG